MKVASMSSALLLSATAIMMAEIRLIHNCKGTVRHQICLFIVGYIRTRTLGSHQVHLLRQKIVLHLFVVIHDCLA